MSPSRPRRPSLGDTFPGHRSPATAPATATAEEAPAVVATAPATAKTSAEEKRALQRKFTVLLEAAESAAFTKLVAQLQERLPKRTVRKSDVVRALVALTRDDATLREQLVDELRSESG